MAKEKTYSLWLIPDGVIVKELNEHIAALSRKYDSPIFQAHITLLGSISVSESQIIEKTALLATKLCSMQLTLGPVENLPDYFKCVFVTIDKLSALTLARYQALAIFNRTSEEIYVPHLSLIYSSMSEKEKKEISLALREHYVSCTVQTNNIAVFVTSGDPQYWHEVARFSLTGTENSSLYP